MCFATIPIYGFTGIAGDSNFRMPDPETGVCVRCLCVCVCNRSLTVVLHLQGEAAPAVTKSNVGVSHDYSCQLYLRDFGISISHWGICRLKAVLYNITTKTR